MRRSLAVLFAVIMAAALWSQSEVTDIRVGSFCEDELLPPGRSGADHTRLIIEMNSLAAYSEQVQGNGLSLVLEQTRCCDDRRTFEVNNGLVARVEMEQQGDSALFRLVLDGRYESHEVRSFGNPPRLIVDVRGTPAEALSQPPSTHAGGGPVIERLNGARPTVRKLDPNELRGFFPSDSPLYLDLLEVPIVNILRWFSQSSTYDIIAAPDVSGTVSLTLQNQTLADAFALLLRSQGLAYIINGNSLMVTHAAATADERQRHTIYVQHIDCLDMKSILLAHLPDNVLMLQDRRLGRLDMLVPPESIATIDSLVAACDTPPPTYSFAVRPLLLPRSVAASLPWRQNGSLVLSASDWPALESSILHEGESRTIVTASRQEAGVSGVYTKSFKTGLPILSSSRVALPSGYELNLTPHIAPGHPIKLAYCVRWHRVSRRLVSTMHTVSGEIPLNVEEIVLLSDTGASQRFDDWTRPQPAWADGGEVVPVLLLLPRLDHIFLD
ncbi:MAG: secretin and TonB N-terminal domain-containing protein [Candidatus Cloacimonetes bacterium]|nr:secretin and TonB N-terminal domain-containing protein [Candidatus Cloacimonadota bacterium]